jgi:hypothetical protein
MKPNPHPPTPAIATLLSPADSSNLWTDADYAALLLHQLRSSLPGAGGLTFGDVLLRDDPDPDHLRQIKDFAKAARDDSASGIPPHVCHVIYYAAIAAAQVRGKYRLTSLDSEAFARGLGWASALSWVPQPLQDLFHDALKPPG